MINKKRMLALVLAGVTALSSLAACGQNETVPSEKESQKSTEQTVAADNTEAKDGEDPAPLTTDAITFTVGVSNSNADDLWIFRYLENYMSELGYDVTIKAENIPELSTQKALMISTNTLPDLVIGDQIFANELISWGEDEGALLNWKDYLQYMPNLSAILDTNSAVKGVMLVNSAGDAYGLPNVGEVTTVKPSNSCNFLVNKAWLEACGISEDELPTTMDGLIDLLREFKKAIDEGKVEGTAYLDGWKGLYLMGTVWGSLGYYPGGNRYGIWYSTKNGEITIPALTDDYDTYITYLNTMFSEGLVQEDLLACDMNVAFAEAAAGKCGIYGSTDFAANTADYENWVYMPPITAGDNTKAIGQISTGVSCNQVWASSNVEYPEVLAIMLDHLYSEEGSLAYQYGPKQGEDPLNELDGWFFDTYGAITCQAVVDEDYASFDEYLKAEVVPVTGYFLKAGALNAAMDKAGITPKYETEVTLTDAVTGETFVVHPTQSFNKEDAKNQVQYYNCLAYEAMKDNLTRTGNETVYMNSQDSLEAQDIYTVVNNYAGTASIELITGKLPLSEIDAVQEELVKLGLPDFLAYYAPYYEEKGIKCADYSSLKK